MGISRWFVSLLLTFHAFPSRHAQTLALDPCTPVEEQELAYRRATLFEEREGFGRNTTGGGDEADWRVVNTTADDGPGSLRSLVGDHDPKWITFNVSGTLFLDSRVPIGANTTIDGRGQSVTIRNHGLYIRFPNVIVSDLSFRNTTNDGITIRGPNVDRIWIHRIDMGDNLGLHKDVADGLVDTTVNATQVTLSWSRFFNHAKGFLVGYNATNTTFHHNAFRSVNTRLPLLDGHVHVYNNYYHDCGPIDIRWNGQLVAESNMFSNVRNSASCNRCVVRFRYDQTLEGAGFRTSGSIVDSGATIPSDVRPETVFDPSQVYAYQLDDASELNDLETRVGPRVRFTIPDPEPCPETLTCVETGICPNDALCLANGTCFVIPSSECPQPECPQPVCPPPECPQPECPQPVCPPPECPQPVCPQPECPQPVCPQPECPQPECPQPVCPQPECPQPVCPQPECPQPEYSPSDPPNAPNSSLPYPESNETQIPSESTSSRAYRFRISSLESTMTALFSIGLIYIA